MFVYVRTYILPYVIRWIAVFSKQSFPEIIIVLFYIINYGQIIIYD